MGKVPVVLRRNIAVNIRDCRHRKYPEWGGSKKCALDFGVSPQQWSQWERGVHMPDEFRMMELADFFGVTTAWLRRDNANGGADAVSRVVTLPGFGAVRLENGREVPLRIEVERVVYRQSTSMALERIL